jgi:hypothetical protein
MYDLITQRYIRQFRTASVGLAFIVLFAFVSLFSYAIVRIIDLLIFQIIFILLLVAFASNVSAKLLTYHLDRS